MTAPPTEPAALAAWHAIASSLDPSGLDELLADDVVFCSPAVYAPQEGKVVTTAYLRAALVVLGPSLRYVHQWADERSAVLEFEADLDGVFVQGVDLLAWNADGRLTSFTVMIRPLRGLQTLIARMGRRCAERSALELGHILGVRSATAASGDAGWAIG